jgi:dolichol-phosphate mannosyltransferase
MLRRVTREKPAGGDGELVSVLVLTLNEAATIGEVLRQVGRHLEREGLRHELIVVDGGSRDGTVALAEGAGARVIAQRDKGYGNALREGLRSCRGDVVVTLDADQSHDPAVVHNLLAARDQADLVIASRYVRFGHAVMPPLRLLLSRILNWIYTSVLSLPIADVSSGFRLYRRALLDAIDLAGEHFDVLPELAVQAYARGFRVREIPFHYRPRAGGTSHARVVAFTPSYLRTLYRYWRLRNSVASADYDFRAFHSRHPFQRYWQRRRYTIVTGYAGRGERGLDVGCGSSVILDALPDVVGLDISLPKLRFMHGHLRNALVAGDIRRLPFADQTFDLLVCSEVIEHFPEDARVFTELRRVLRVGGSLVIGTPDYARLAWRVIEEVYRRVAPGAYADEHVCHYTFASLCGSLEQNGFRVLDHAYICGAELIVKAERIA